MNIPDCGEINFSFFGTYSPPACNLINFEFIETSEYSFVADHSEVLIQCSENSFFTGIVLASDDSEIIIESSSENIEILTQFSDSQDEVLIQTISPNIGDTKPYNLPTNTAGGFVFSWKEPQKADAHKRIPWEEAKEIKKEVIIPFIGPKKIQISSKIPWDTLTETYIRTEIVFDEFDEVNKTCSFPFITKMKFLDQSLKVVWKIGTPLDKLCNVVYYQPQANDKLINIIYGGFESKDKEVKCVYRQPAPKDKFEYFSWGPFSYYTLCNNLKYYPPKCPIKFSFPNKYPLTPDICEGIRFNINVYSSDPRCPYDHWHSGIRDSGSGIITREPLQYPKTKRAYRMFNEVYVEEVVSKSPIEVLSIDAKIDKNSWLWSFSLTVASKCYLDLIRPINGIMGHIKITMNTYTWYCSVEGWSESRTFGSQSWTITGRSPSMMFGEPVSQKTSGSIGIGKQGQTIIEDIVQAKQLPPYWPEDFQSWTADFGIYNESGKVSTGFKPFLNWFIPENTINYTEKTEIQLLKELSESIGAYIQSSRDENKLIFEPLYPHQPWDWNSGNTDIDWIGMNESQLVEIGRSNDLKPFYQAVHVVGESIGGSDSGGGADPSNTAVFTDVRRAEYGPSTASYAPMITNPYVTSSKVALELGRMQIAQTGEWLNHTLKIGMLCPSGESFGLFKTGDMISVLERGISWYGQVTGVSVIAASTGGGFAVQQVIQVQEYRGV